jgi:hypothetical protein
MTTDPDPEIIRELMLFTNDLDATRKQSIAQSCPELVQLMAEDGFEWISEKRFAQGATQRPKPARERDYAWL